MPKKDFFKVYGGKNQKKLNNYGRESHENDEHELNKSEGSFLVLKEGKKPEQSQQSSADGPRQDISAQLNHDRTE